MRLLDEEASRIPSDPVCSLEAPYYLHTYTYIYVYLHTHVHTGGVYIYIHIYIYRERESEREPLWVSIMNMTSLVISRA